MRSRKKTSLPRWLALLPIFLLLFFDAASAGAQVILIESPGCSKCAAAERVLSNITDDNPDISLLSYDYFSPEGERAIEEHGAKEVPSLIIGDRVINYKDYKGDNQKLDRLIRDALANLNLNESSGHNQVDANQSRELEAEMDLTKVSPSTVLTVFGAGFLAGFNPCLLGILVFLAASIMSSSGRRRDLLIMIAFFSLGIFTMYFLFGLGMQHVMQAKSVADAFRYTLTFILIILGLAHVEDARRLSKGDESLFKSDWMLKYIESEISRRRLSSYFLIGALFSLVKAPCVGAVYLAILDLISSQSYAEGSVYLLFYNLGIVLPILILGGLIAMGMGPEQVDQFRKNYRGSIRLVTGLALLALAPLIYFRLI